MESIMIAIILFTYLVYVFDKKRKFSNEKKIILNHEDMDPEQRIAKLAALYAERNWSVQTQNKHMVQFTRKRSFSWILMIILFLFGVVFFPMWFFMLLYLLYYAVKRDQSETITL